MDSFYAFPSNTIYSPFTPLNNTSHVIIEDTVTPIIPYRTNQITYPKTITNWGTSVIVQPTSAYYYDSGIGENTLAQHDTNVDLRYKFLDKWLYEDYPDILRMLKIIDGSVKVLSEEETKTNDISKDTVEDLDKKSRFIGTNILSLAKNKKILNKIVLKTNMKWYDLPYNEHFVRKHQARYVRKKLEEMRKN